MVFSFYSLVRQNVFDSDEISCFHHKIGKDAFFHRGKWKARKMFYKEWGKVILPWTHFHFLWKLLWSKKKKKFWFLFDGMSVWLWRCSLMKSLVMMLMRSYYLFFSWCVWCDLRNSHCVDLWFPCLIVVIFAVFRSFNDFDIKKKLMVYEDWVLFCFLIWPSFPLGFVFFLF